MVSPQRVAGAFRRRRLIELLVVAGVLAGVAWFYHWTVKTAGGFNPPGEEDYYNFLVRGWRKGQLHLAKVPQAEMKTLADPYDPKQNGPFRLADASYYKENYYLYFGAAPALVVMAPYGLVTGRELGTTSVIFIFCLTGFVASSTVWLKMRARYFPDSRLVVAVAGVLALGFGTHVLALQRRPLVWELPIAAAYGFSMIALLLLFYALTRRWIMGWFVVGLAFGLAIASRPLHLIGLIAFAPIVLWAWRDRTHGHAPHLRGIIWGGAGIALCIAAICAHNYARFDHPLEFGQNYQLSGVYESKMRHFGLDYLVHNLGIYFLSVPKVSAAFPFISATATHTGPTGYLAEWNEAVCGFLISAPLILWGLGWRLGWHERTDADYKVFKVLSACVVLFAGAMAVAMLSYFLATPRYMVDFAPSLVLVALLGMLQIERRLQRGRGLNVFYAAVSLSALVTAGMGILLSFDYHNRIFKVTAPAQWEKLERTFTPASSDR